MKLLDLFSGIGGFSLAARWCGWETVQFVEIDKFCHNVLAKNFAKVPIHDDVRTFTAEPFRGSIDILTGGYPCQPFSSAGKRKGAADDRHLWPQVLRIIQECRPRWVVCENVAGHITMGLDAVLYDLESEGYACRPIVIPACATNAPHRRDRVWIIANDMREQTKRDHSGGFQHKPSGGGTSITHSQGERCGEAGRVRCDESEEWTTSGSEAATDTASNGCGSPRPESAGLVGKSIAHDAPAPDATDANTARTQGTSVTGSDGGNGSESNDEYLRRCDLASPGDSAGTRLQDRIGPQVDRSQQDAQLERPNGREAESGFRGSDDGLSRRMDFDRVWQTAPLVYYSTAHAKAVQRVNRLKALGNAIVPQVAYEIFRAIETADRETEL